MGRRSNVAFLFPHPQRWLVPWALQSRECRSPSRVYFRMQPLHRQGTPELDMSMLAGAGLHSFAEFVSTARTCLRPHRAHTRATPDLKPMGLLDRDPHCRMEQSMSAHKRTRFSAGNI